MLRLILPIILLLLGLGAGVGAGLFLGQPEPEDASSAPPDEGETAPAPEDAPQTAATPAGSESGPSGSGATEYVRLNNQFVVPIVRDGSVRSLVVLSLTVEVDLGNAQAVFGQEPRLRDSFLQVLFAHANAGGFDGSFTQAVAMDPLRAALRDAARQALGPVMRDVLIVDITRQDA